MEKYLHVAMRNTALGTDLNSATRFFMGDWFVPWFKTAGHLDGSGVPPAAGE